MKRICFALIAIAATTWTVAKESHEPADWTLQVIPVEERSFDFKMVGKGVTPEHPFILKNPFQEPLVIKSITSSCTCTTVHFDEAQTTLPPYGEMTIGARFRGDLFDGQKTATLTVLLDKPKPTEIQLNVRGEVRPDLQISPAFLDFGNVEIEQGASQTLTVTYSGANAQWQLVDTRREHEFVRAEIMDISSDQAGIVEFRVNVSLDKSAPNGVLNTHLFLVSNDAADRREIPIPLRATVGTVIRATPSRLFLGIMPPGEQTPLKNAVLLGTKPFRISKIECNNLELDILLEIDADAPAKRMYSIPIRYKNPADGEGAPKDGVMLAEVRVTTDIPGLAPTFYVMMRVRENEAKENE